MPAKKVNIDHLIDSYLELTSSDPAALDDMLKEYGYSPEAVEKRSVQHIRKLLFQQQVTIKKSNLLSLYSRAASMVQVAAANTRQGIFTLLKQKSPSFQFRNLEQLDEENLRQILNETEILDLIDKLEKGELK